MKDWLENLDQRERVFVAGGAAVVAVALLYVFVWAPLDKGHKALVSSIATWELSLAELRSLTIQSQAAAGSIRPSTDAQQAPVVIVDQTLRVRNLDGFLKRSQPTTNDGIRVEFENVVFDDLVLWLGDLSDQHAMHVSSGSFTAVAKAGPGHINATLTLERAP